LEKSQKTERLCYTMALREPNFMRKAQRVTLPLLVKIDDKAYKAKDWSLTGVGIENFNTAINLGERCTATLVIPLQEASIHLKVALICRRKDRDVVGFEFADLSSKNRRVLRHYVELAVTGQLDRLEDLVAVRSEPDIGTPIEEALVLTEEEQVRLVRSFKRWSFFWIAAGVSLIFIIIVTLFYNVFYVFKGTGVVSKDIVNIKSGHKGKIEEIFVKPGDPVRKGTILFQINFSDLSLSLKQLEQQTEALEKQLNTIAAQISNESPLATLKAEYENMLREYKRAQILYRKKIISFKDFNFVRERWLESKLNYLRSLEKRKEKKTLLENRLNNLKDREKQVLTEIEKRRIRSPIDGRVFAVKSVAGAPVSEQEVVVSLVPGCPPFVLVKVPSWQLEKIRLDKPVKIFSLVTRKNYVGKVLTIGYNALEPQVSPAQEVSLKQTVLKVQFEDPTVVLPMNSRVKVWFRKSLPVISW